MYDSTLPRVIHTATSRGECEMAVHYARLDIRYEAARFSQASWLHAYPDSGRTTRQCSQKKPKNDYTALNKHCSILANISSIAAILRVAISG